MNLRERTQARGQVAKVVRAGAVDTRIVAGYSNPRHFPSSKTVHFKHLTATSHLQHNLRSNLMAQAASIQYDEILFVNHSFILHSRAVFLE